MTEKQLAPHQQRVVTEREELAEKVGKLHDFTLSLMFGELHADEQQRLHRQLLIMRLYLQVLTERIAAF